MANDIAQSNYYGYSAKVPGIIAACISTGAYKFPRDLASKMAVKTVSDWLKEKNNPIKVVFCVYNDFDRKLYEEAFNTYEIK